MFVYVFAGKKGSDMKLLLYIGNYVLFILVWPICHLI